MNKIQISEIGEKLIGYDLFICCSSFESRCLEIANKLDSNQLKKVIICNFEDNSIGEAESNLEKLKEKFRVNNLVIEISRINSLQNYDRLYDELSNSDVKNVLLDISTFTREIFLMIIQLFRQEKFNDINLEICYTPIEKYFSDENLEENKLWLSKGVSNIRSIFGYSGDFSPIKKLMLIVLVGFEAERAQILIDSFEPSLLYVGKASSSGSVSDKIADINSRNYNKILMQNSNAKEFEFSCLDMSETITTLSKIIEENKDMYNIVISPMSNKISTLAVASTVFQYPEVQICYASTNLYNTGEKPTPSDFIYTLNSEEL